MSLYLAICRYVPLYVDICRKLRNQTGNREPGSVNWEPVGTRTSMNWNRREPDVRELHRKRLARPAKFLRVANVLWVPANDLRVQNVLRVKMAAPRPLPLAAPSKCFASVKRLRVPAERLPPTNFDELFAF